jgi:transcriptional regulator with XRE-family HTH domain
MSIAMSIGARIRALRRRSGLRLQDVADRCGFTQSLLSKIETGAANPPVATLVAIAGALRVPVATLIEDTGGARTVVSRAADPDERTDKGYRFRLLAGERADKAAQPFLFQARRGEVTPGGLRHPGEEFVYVLAGRAEFRVGSTAHVLGPGDSLYFDSEEEHDVTPLTATATWLALFIEPAAKPRGRRATDRTEASWARGRSRR